MNKNKIKIEVQTKDHTLNPNAPSKSIETWWRQKSWKQP
jgi:hypothetical protein